MSDERSNPGLLGRVCIYDQPALQANCKLQASSSVDQKEFPYPIEQVVKSSFYATAHSTAMVDVNMLHEFVQLRTSMSRKNKGGYASS